MAMIDPRGLTRSGVPVIPHLERVVADGTEFPGTAPVEVAPGRHRLEFYFTAPSFVSPEEHSTG
jgi:hypothetical protein